MAVTFSHFSFDSEIKYTNLFPDSLCVFNNLCEENERPAPVGAGLSATGTNLLGLWQWSLHGSGDKLHHDLSQLGAGGGVLRRQAAVVLAGDQAVLHRPSHGLGGPAGDGRSVLELGQVTGHSARNALGLGVAVQGHRDLLTGDGAVGVGAVRHAVLHGPILGVGVPGLARRGTLLALQAVEHGPQHGTGHGIGYLSEVHEGRVSISSKCEGVIEEGMILSNEPGFYEDNVFGIRLENMMLTHKARDGLLEFETISLVPFDYKFILTDMLTSFEVNWLNEYHRKIFEQISSVKGITSFV